MPAISHNVVSSFNRDIVGGSVPENLLLFNNLLDGKTACEGVRRRRLCHWPCTHNFVRIVRLPIADGIVPPSRLFDKSLWNARHEKSRTMETKFNSQGSQIHQFSNPWGNDPVHSGAVNVPVNSEINFPQDSLNQRAKQLTNSRPRCHHILLALLLSIPYLHSIFCKGIHCNLRDQTNKQKKTKTKNNDLPLGG